jgi:cysteine desulfurase
LLPLEKVSDICKSKGAYFLADTVQSLGKYKLDFNRAGMDIAACSAHKFHGPKGVGFLYLRKGLFMQPLLLGGGQERQMRSGTENIAGIVGLATALKIALEGVDTYAVAVWELRDHLAERIKNEFPESVFNNDLSENGLYNLLNVGFPKHCFNDMLLQQLDVEGICASGGSACTSGATSVSPVLKAVGCDTTRPTIRFSFSKFNTVEETHTCLQVLKSLAK